MTPVSHLKLLGVTIENNLKWDKHIQSTIKAASSSLYLLRKCHKIFNKQQLIMLYNSFVLSKLCYAASAFISLPQKHCRPFKKLQTRVHFIICGYDCDEKCLIDPADQKLNIAKNLFAKALSEKQHPLNCLMPRMLTYSKKLCVPLSRSDRYRKSFLPHMTILFNSFL